jgi:hypothetical protein
MIVVRGLWGFAGLLKAQQLVGLALLAISVTFPQSVRPSAAI